MFTSSHFEVVASNAEESNKIGMMGVIDDEPEVQSMEIKEGQIMKEELKDDVKDEVKEEKNQQNEEAKEAIKDVKENEKNVIETLEEKKEKVEVIKAKKQIPVVIDDYESEESSKLEPENLVDKDEGVITEAVVDSLMERCDKILEILAVEEETEETKEGQLLENNDSQVTEVVEQEKTEILEKNN